MSPSPVPLPQPPALFWKLAEKKLREIVVYLCLTRSRNKKAFDLSKSCREDNIYSTSTRVHTSYKSKGA